MVWGVLLRVAGWIALAKLIIEHIGFVFIASVGEEICDKPSKISWRGNGE